MRLEDCLGLLHWAATAYVDALAFTHIAHPSHARLFSACLLACLLPLPLWLFDEISPPLARQPDEVKFALTHVRQRTPRTAFSANRPSTFRH